jgi:hypothetical protein
MAIESHPSASLMHDLIKTTSSHKLFFDQFHMKALYILTLLCFIYNMKFKRCCSSNNLQGLLKIIGISPIMFKYDVRFHT